MLHSKILRGNSGFTLVELMVAVGITGALSAVAVPNYLKYVAKSHQGEAKISLSAIYVSEKQFATEFGYYTACLNKAGFVPQNERYYAIGYSRSAATDLKCGPQNPGNYACNNISTNLQCDSTALTGNPTSDTAAVTAGLASAYPAVTKYGTAFPKDEDFSLPSGMSIPGPNPNTMTGVGRVAFSVGAVGSISKGSTLDKWIINQDKTVINVQSGI